MIAVAALFAGLCTMFLALRFVALRFERRRPGPEDWVPAEHYEEAKARSEKLREVAFSAIEDDEERALNEAHWPFDDMDEKDYM